MPHLHATVQAAASTEVRRIGFARHFIGASDAGGAAVRGHKAIRFGGLGKAAWSVGPTMPIYSLAP